MKGSTTRALIWATAAVCIVAILSYRTLPVFKASTLEGIARLRQYKAEQAQALAQSSINDDDLGAEVKDTVIELLREVKGLVKEEMASTWRKDRGTIELDRREWEGFNTSTDAPRAVALTPQLRAILAQMANMHMSSNTYTTIDAVVIEGENYLTATAERRATLRERLFKIYDQFQAQMRSSMSFIPAEDFEKFKEEQRHDRQQLVHTFDALDLYLKTNPQNLTPLKPESKAGDRDLDALVRNLPKTQSDKAYIGEGRVIINGENYLAASAPRRAELRAVFFEDLQDLHKDSLKNEGTLAQKIINKTFSLVTQKYQRTFDAIDAALDAGR